MPINHNHRLSIHYLPINQLKANPRNPRRHSKGKLKILARSIQALGLNCPILIDANQMILAKEVIQRIWSYSFC